MPKRVFLLLLLLLLALPRRAQAAACCGGGHGLGARLSPMERAAIGISFRAADRFGSFDPAGRFFSIPSGYRDIELRSDISLLFAPLRRLQLGVVIPTLLNVRKTRAQSAWGGGLADVLASARVDLVPLSSPSGWPALALTCSLSLPTGTPLEQSKDALGAGATGLGAAEARPGLFLEKTWEGRATLVAAASIGFRAPRSSSLGEHLQLGPRSRFLIAAGPVFHSGLSFSFGLLHERERAPSVDSIAAENGERRRTAILGFAGYDLSQHWTLLGSVEMDLPILKLGTNEHGAMAFSLGLRRALARTE